MYLASISDDLKIYETENWTHKFTHGKQDVVLKHIEWSDDGKYLLQVNSAGNTELLSATENGVRCLQCVLPAVESTAGAFQRGGHRKIAVGCKNGKMFIWDTKYKHIEKSLTYAPSTVKMLDFNCKNKYLAAGLENGDTILYNILTNTQNGVIKVPFSNKVSAIRFHHELRSVLGLASDEGCILLRDLDNGKNKMFKMDAHKSVVSGIGFSPINRDVMFSCGYDKKLNIYDIRLIDIVTTIPTDCPLSCVDMHSDSKIALGNKKGELLLYDLRTYKKPLNIFSDHKSAITKLCFQPDVAKRKIFLTLDASLKEPCSPKLNTPLNSKQSKIPDPVRSYEFIEHFNSCNDAASPLKEKVEVSNGSKDSFLVNIIGSGIDSEKTKNSPVARDPDFLTKRVVDFSFRKKALKADSYNALEKISGVTSSSTPIAGRAFMTENATPSPIPKNFIELCEDVDGGSNNISNSPVNNDLVSSVSAETIQCKVNAMTALGNELKDFITYSLYDVLEQSRNNFLQMTIQQTKNRIFLEDQISSLAHRVKDLQQTQNILIEENKRLSIEVEMLRSARL